MCRGCVARIVTSDLTFRAISTRQPASVDEFFDLIFSYQISHEILHEKLHYIKVLLIFCFLRLFQTTSLFVHIIENIGNL